MRLSTQLFVGLFLLFTLPVLVFAQSNVGVNTNNPNGNSEFEVVSPGNNRGVLIPRMDSTQRNAMVTGNPLVVGDKGLLVYDTDYNCIFSWTGTTWKSLCGGGSVSTGTNVATGGGCSVKSVDLTTGSTSVGDNSGLVRIVDSCNNTITSTNAAWITRGNYKTSPANDYIGTNDNADFVVRTGGTAITNERFRVTSAGRLVANNTTPFATDIFSSYANGYNGTTINNFLGTRAVAGYSSGATSTSIYGSNTGAGIGVHGTVGSGTGALGESTGNGTGVKGVNTSSGIGVWGVISGTAAAQGIAVKGETTFGGQAGVFNSTGGTVNTAAGESPTLQVYSGNIKNVITLRCDNGSSGATPGTAIAGVGTGINTAFTTGTSTGGSFTGNSYGVFGMSYIGNSGGTTAGGLFIDSMSAVLDFNAMVCAYTAGTNYKIIGSGTVATLVDDIKGQRVVMHAPEAPEALFEDYGTGQLVNGEAYITLDPTYTKNITVNEKHPLRVIVQLEGDCNGVFVTEKTSKGFMVKELAGGKSNVKFTYHVVGNRADEYKNGQLVSKFADLRYVPYTGKPKLTGIPSSMK